MEWLVVGRWWMGVTSGMVCSVGAKVLSEMVPVHLLGIYGSTISIAMT